MFVQGLGKPGGYTLETMESYRKNNRIKLHPQLDVVHPRREGHTTVCSSAEKERKKWLCLWNGSEIGEIDRLYLGISVINFRIGSRGRKGSQRAADKTPLIYIYSFRMTHTEIHYKHLQALQSM